MSQNIIIQQDGVEQQLSAVQKIKTAKYDGGTVNWIAEDDYQLSPLTISENGTYTPGSGVYGFGVVKVDVKVIRGTINGVEYVVTVDENGYLVYTEVTA